MTNYYIYTIFLTEIFLICAAALSLAANDRTKKIIFQISYALVLFVVIIKYYFSSDIATYVPAYEKLSPLQSLTLKEINDCYFEPGYTIFCSLLKTFGFSFWMMTATVTVLIMHSLYKLLSIIPKYSTLGLTIFFFVGFDLLFQQFRQALAISFFFYAIINIINGKSSIKILLLSLLSCSFHTSAIFLIIPLLIFSKFGEAPIQVQRSAFVLLFVVFIISIFIDFEWLINHFSTSFNLSSSQKASLAFHFGVNKILQSFLLVYIPLFLILTILPDNRTDKVSLTFRIITYIGMAYIALFYKYNLFVNRFSNYITVISIIYSLDLLHYNFKILKTHHCRLALQCCNTLLILFFTYRLIPNIIAMSSSHTYQNTPTVLRTLFMNKKQIEKLQQEQIDKAIYFWENELTDMYENTAKNFNFSTKK